jgi:hypothetical protein
MQWQGQVVENLAGFSLAIRTNVLYNVGVVKIGVLAEILERLLRIA